MSRLIGVRVQLISYHLIKLASNLRHATPTTYPPFAAGYGSHLNEPADGWPGQITESGCLTEPA